MLCLHESQVSSALQVSRNTKFSCYYSKYVPITSLFFWLVCSGWGSSVWNIESTEVRIGRATNDTLPNDTLPCRSCRFANRGDERREFTDTRSIASDTRSITPLGTSRDLELQLTLLKQELNRLLKPLMILLLMVIDQGLHKRLHLHLRQALSTFLPC